MEIKQCEFDKPAEKRSSTSLSPRMFNEDVGFRFEVNIKVTDRKQIEEMLKLFEQAAEDFKETWSKKMAGLH
jgi:glucan biosynthesis protein